MLTSRSEKLPLRHELATVFDQATENRERLGREGHHVAVVQELLGGEIQGTPISIRSSRVGNRFLTAF